jgi:hypothetical protein
MRAFEALTLAAGDLWEDSWLLVGTGLVGGLASLLLLPLPFVLAAHYGVAEKITGDRAVSVRVWLQCGREHARFFYKWMLMFVAVSVIFYGNLYFYWRYEAAWAQILGWVVIGLWLLWLLPQPFVLAVYFWQSDRRVRVALRNGVLLALSDPLSLFILWGSTLLLAIPLGYTSELLLFLLPPWMVLLSTRIVWLHLKNRVGSTPKAP